MAQRNMHVFEGNISNSDVHWNYGTETAVPGHNDATTEVVIGSLLTVAILATNILFVCAVLMTKGLREKPSNWLLLDLAAADLLVGLLVTSFMSYLKGHDLQWELSHHLCIFWLLADVLLSCTSIYILIAINVDRCLFIIYPGQYSRRIGRRVMAVMVALPWLLAFCIVLPLFFRGRRDGFSIKDNLAVSKMCYIELLPSYATVSSVLGYFLPGAFLVAANAVAFRVTLNKVKENQQRLSSAGVGSSGGGGGADEEGDEDNTTAIGRIKQAVMVLCVVNLTYLLMWLPFFFISLLSASDMYHVLSPVSFDVALWLGYANAAVNPLIWLLHADIRKAFANLLCCRFDRNRDGFYLNDDDTEDMGVNAVVDA